MSNYLKDFWRYGQLHVNYGTLKEGLVAKLDQVTLKYLKGHQFTL